ncbi:MAG: hypothetical protein ABW049_09175 [Spongiibacteraceae bacterium]
MLQAHDYTNAFDRTFVWGLYLGCGLLAFAIFIWLTQRWQRDIRLLLLALMAVLMFLPAPVPGHDASAPAFIFIALGVLSGSVEAMAPVLVRFSLVAILIVVLVVVEGFWWRLRRRRRVPAAKQAGSARRPAKP